MSYTHILPQERVLIEEYKLAEKSLSYIARQLKRSKSTIKYEIGSCLSLQSSSSADGL